MVAGSRVTISPRKQCEAEADDSFLPTSSIPLTPRHSSCSSKSRSRHCTDFFQSKPNLTIFWAHPCRAIAQRYGHIGTVAPLTHRGYRAPHKKGRRYGLHRVWSKGVKEWNCNPASSWVSKSNSSLGNCVKLEGKIPRHSGCLICSHWESSERKSSM